MGISLRYEGPVAVLTWDDGENRVNHDVVARLDSLLDEIESNKGSQSIVFQGVGKFFSNGMDLARFTATSQEFLDTINELDRTIGRLLLFPAYTVAVLNGHTFAAGAILSCGFDYRVMREDRGFWCLNEAEIGIAINARTWSVIHHRLPFATASAAVQTARRFSGPEALEAGIVEAIRSEDELLSHAMEVAERFSSLERETLRHHKALAHADVARRLGWVAAE